MALLNCIECNHIVSDKASACPNCGCPVSFSLDVSNMAEAYKPEPQKCKSVRKYKTRKRRKYKKLPNGFGCIKKLSGNRSRPFAAYPSTKEFHNNGSPVSQPAIGYYEDWYQAFDALREFNSNPYDLVHNNITFAELFELYFKDKYINNKKKKYSPSSIDSTKAAFKNCKDKILLGVKQAITQMIQKRGRLDEKKKLLYMFINIVYSMFYGMCKRRK